MNYSKQREIILDTLKSNVVHPTAEYIYEILKKEDSKISLATFFVRIKIDFARLGIKNKRRLLLTKANTNVPDSK